MRTILFDIDGTLIRTSGAGKLAMELALRQAFGVPEVRDVVPYAGRTDRAIGYDLLREHQLDPTEAHYDRLQAAYLQELPGCLQSLGGVVCPGVPALLDVLHARRDIRLGLITGNTRAGAQLKLEHFALWDYFPTGGFGDRHADRNLVARDALRAMQQHHQVDIAPESVWILGDTPLDIQCARAIGAKVLAVGTGWHPPEMLQEADRVFADLNPLDEVLSVLLA